MTFFNRLLYGEWLQNLLYNNIFCRLILTSLYAPTKIPATSGGPMVDFEYKQMSDGNQHGNTLSLYETNKKRRKETKQQILFSVKLILSFCSEH